MSSVRWGSTASSWQSRPRMSSAEQRMHLSYGARRPHRRPAPSQRERRVFDRIIVETSGLADPAPVIQSFILDDVLRTKFSLDAMITVVEAAHLPWQLEHKEAREQIAFVL